MSIKCSHLDQIHPVTPSANGCEECLKIGDEWVHLRMCMICGHVGCCDSSKNKHATAHFHETSHPIMRSIEPGEPWGWCYVDQYMIPSVERYLRRHAQSPPSQSEVGHDAFDKTINPM